MQTLFDDDKTEKLTKELTSHLCKLAGKKITDSNAGCTYEVMCIMAIIRSKQNTEYPSGLKMRVEEVDSAKERVIEIPVSTAIQLIASGYGADAYGHEYKIENGI